MSKGAWTRIIVFILAWINTALANWGYDLPNISEEFISIVVAAVISVHLAWKNNSVTKKAIQADHYLKSMKGEK